MTVNLPARFPARRPAIGDPPNPFGLSGGAYEPVRFRTLGGGGGGGAATAVPLQGFYAHNGAAQTIPNSWTQANFDVEVFDTEDAFASGTFTVPESLNGKYMVFSYGTEQLTGGTLWPLGRLERSTGGAFSIVAQTYNGSGGSPGLIGQSQPLQLVTGHQYRILFYFITSGGGAAADDTRTFFSGYVIDPVVTGDTSAVFSGFFAWKNFNSQVSSGYRVVPLDTVEYDTEGAFDISTDVFTVPESLNGKYMVFAGGYGVTSGFGSGDIGISFDIDTGGGWQTIRQLSEGRDRQSASTPPILLNTGDQHRMRINPFGGPRNSQTGFPSFYSGHVINPSVAGFTNPGQLFHVHTSTNQAITSGAEVVPTWEVEVHDTEDAFDSGVFTVPASLDGKYMEFCFGVDDSSNSGSTTALKLQKENVRGGWGTIHITSTGTGSVAARTGRSAPILLASGEKYRLAVETNGTDTLLGGTRTFFSGHVLNPDLIPA